MLSPYRVLDLTDESGFLCGRLLADLGADVIKVEPPGGDPARRIGPFYGDDSDPEKSLYWFAFNANKRGITVDLQSPAGHDQFAALVATADIVVESFAPGRMDEIGFGYEAIRRINPGCILVSISPFGQTGPYRDYKAPDIVAWALGGHMSICGPPGGPPYHVSHHSQATLLGGGDAAVGALIALHQRERTGVGQHVDVAIRDAVVNSTYQITADWDMTRTNRAIGERAVSINFPWVWPCKDGYVVTVLWSGDQGNARTKPQFDWAAAARFEDPVVSAIDWDRLTPDNITPEMFDAIVALLERFFAVHTMQELYEGGLAHGLIIGPVQNAADLAASPQLRARQFWQDLEHEYLGSTLTYPGPWAKGVGAPPTLRHRAPRIGEHNDEILLPTRGPRSRRHPRSTCPRPQAARRESRSSTSAGFMVGPRHHQRSRRLRRHDRQDRIPPPRPDSIRLVGPHKDGIFGIDRGGDNAQHRTSEFGIALNLQREEGRDVARRLVAWADIVFDNFAAGAMERIGFGYDAVRAIKPDVIMLSCCGQGQTGPHRMAKGGGAHYVALGGLNHLSGPPDGPPEGVSVLHGLHRPPLQHPPPPRRARPPPSHRARRLLRGLPARDRGHLHRPGDARLLRQRSRRRPARQPPRERRPPRGLPLRRRPLVRHRHHGRAGMAGFRRRHRRAPLDPRPPLRHRHGPQAARG